MKEIREEEARKAPANFGPGASVTRATHAHLTTIRHSKAVVVGEEEVAARRKPAFISRKAPAETATPVLTIMTARCKGAGAGVEAGAEAEGGMLRRRQLLASVLAAAALASSLGHR